MLFLFKVPEEQKFFFIFFELEYGFTQIIGILINGLS